MNTARSPRKQQRYEDAKQRRQAQHDERIAGIAKRIRGIFANCTPEELRDLLKLHPENRTIALAQRGALSDRTRVDRSQSNRRGQKVIKLQRHEQELIIEALRDESVIELIAELLNSSKPSEAHAPSKKRFTQHRYEQLATMDA